MAQSFTLRPLPAAAQSGRRKVLVIGAAGNIGSYFAEHSNKRYDLRLMVRNNDDKDSVRRFGEIVTGDLVDLDGLKKLCAGIDTIVHMAGDPSPTATWQELLDANIIGTYNIFAAAKTAGVRRIIYASSIHAVSGYPPDYQVHTNDPVNPGDLYGVSKCFSEALARYMAEKEGVSAICLRIGGFQPTEPMKGEKGIGMLDAWVSRRDLNQLIEKCIDAEHIQFAIFHGLSDNRFKRLDITDARELVGYAPQDDLTQANPQVSALHLKEKVKTHSGVIDAGKSGTRNETR
jgi:NAD(P)-dependent dehydrogenase (short-subunit alcohol dehydrogenase family)